MPNISGLHDAFTGAPLNPTLGLHQCSKCKVFYHTESFEVLRQENNGQCVACLSSDIRTITGQAAKEAGGRNHDPNAITLANYQHHVGRAVTFEGRVHKVITSKRGTDFAVMFEDKSWAKGFKLVCFHGSISAVGGAAFIKGLSGKVIRARGLLKKHPVFGYEIIISERSMILSIQ